ncbi:hypothetical protein ODJ79_22620 [Actinoplanes sp. KI2]|uniref:hypothetical protein n=1 Tax=Actinoplanes sp. KI2 TaxID=2983315 RepID=UPI0021D602EB|nr:hypothetical protein [Actinoplanes sp. KI2]MCU7726535.1 hypothetical protein [Actinoplanes sp. KI2]
MGLLYVTGLVAGRPLPFGGTLATASVLAIALVAGPSGEPRWTRLVRVAGLAAVTACAAIVDAQYGGNGWPVHPTHWAASLTTAHERRSSPGSHTSACFPAGADRVLPIDPWRTLSSSVPAGSPASPGISACSPACGPRAWI